jgi:hypothetical protein
MDTTVENKVKHTPGPWVAEGSTQGLFESYNEGVGVGDPSGYCLRITTTTRLAIDVWGHGASKEETRATANIIAASPDLLEIVQMLSNHSALENEPSIKFMIQKALEKATK